MKIKTKCQECGGHNLRWQSTVVNNSEVQQGRLRTHEMGVLFFLGCEDCSATVQHASGDQIARHLNDAAPFSEVAEVDARESARYRLLRRGQHWSVIDGKGDVLRGDELDATIDARLAAQAAPAAPAVDAWQPIESAPVEKFVLVAAEFDGPGDWRIKIGDLRRDGIWHVLGASWKPTRWMPLPPAPGKAASTFTHAELLEIKRAVEEFADCNETDVDYALLLRAAQAGYLECTQFHVLNQSALDLDTVAAAQAKEGGA